MPPELSRFIVAQETSWPTAIAELRQGRKRSHWMWWVFPQIAGLGRSETARHYAIQSLEEARAYLAHPLLGPRLLEATAALMAAPESAEDILGSVDAIKLRSSLTLFDAIAEDGAPFHAALDQFFDGERDAATLALI